MGITKKLCGECRRWETCERAWVKSKQCSSIKKISKASSIESCFISCQYLMITEEEQTRMLKNGIHVFHFCKKYKKRLHHGKFENGMLEKLKECLILEEA